MLKIDSQLLFYNWKNLRHLLTGCFEENIDYRGGNITGQIHPLTESADGCQKLCQKDANCSYWTWANPSHFIPNVCYFKENIEIRGYRENTTSGPKLCDGMWNILCLYEVAA